MPLSFVFTRQPMKPYLTFLILIFTSIYFGSSMDKNSIIIKDKNQNKINLDSSLEETSGLTFIGGRLYTINDSGNKATIFETDLSGNILRTHSIDIDYHDFESISHGACIREKDKECLFVMDTGDNLFVRKDYYIYEINLSSFSDGSFKKISFNYLNNESIDLEASAVTDEGIFLFSKGFKTRIFKLEIDKTYKSSIKEVARLPIYKTTGAYYLDGEFYILNLNNIFKINRNDFSNSKKLIAYDKPKSFQSEAIAVSDDRIYFTSEASKNYLKASLFILELDKLKRVENYKSSYPPYW